MRKRVSLPLAGLAVVSTFACLVPLAAQNPIPPPTPPPSSQPPVSPYPAAPTPVPSSAPIPSESGYSNQSTTPQAAPQQALPAAQQIAAPAIVPAQTTPAAPFVAMPAYEPYGIPDEDRKKHAYGSTYIPVDSWVYDAFMRLYSLGYAQTMFLSLRPYTRQAALHILENCQEDVRESDSDEAKQIFVALTRELQDEVPSGNFLTGEGRGSVYGLKSTYTRLQGITGQTLRDSYHLGQTLNNDYGRPYEQGFNSMTGFSAIAERGRFSFDFRGEFQQAPSAVGYSQALQTTLSHTVDMNDLNPVQLRAATLPQTNIGSAHHFRLQEATASFHLAGHEFSFGKSDAWIGPGKGGAFAWSNNAENIYAVRVNRVEPLHIPYISAILGDIRYDFFYGSLKGHTAPNHPFVHSESLAFRPTKNLEFNFQRTIVFGGAGHEPANLHTFLKGFFDINDTTAAEKAGRDDPGARFTAFSFSYRLPFLRKYATLYTDSEAHDDVTPPSAPRRAAYRPGLYISQFPGARKLSFRIEGASTDTSTLRSLDGGFNYYETIQRQAYTNQGFIFGDWIGREAKGGQAWLTYHLSGDELVELEYLNKKTPKDFIPGGVTQNSFKVNVVKRFRHDDIELNGWFQYEKFNAPIYLPVAQSNTATAVQITFFPKLKTKRSK